MSYSHTRTATFTITNARHLSSKVAADMHLCAQYYGKPTEERIRLYAEELAQYISAGYIAEYEFGYKRNNQRIVSWRYRVDENGVLASDDRAGKIISFVDVTGAAFFNYLTQNARFLGLTPTEQSNFEESLSIRRNDVSPLSDGAGFWKTDRNYYSGGRGVSRETFQPV